MPLYIPPINRRNFIKTTSILSAGYLFGLHGSLFANNPEVDPNYFVLIADTHIDRNRNFIAYSQFGNVNVADNLSEVVQRIINLERRPSAVIINGDAARVDGKKEDYLTLGSLLSQLWRANIPMFITMGNHDDRDKFKETMPDFFVPEQEFVESKLIFVVETPNSYLILLDTLKEVNQTPGILGPEQLQWLDEALLTYHDKPVLIFGHHFPETGSERGLLDYDDFMEIIKPHKHVKAYIYGHSHRFNLQNNDGIHEINQPSTAYVFRETSTSAFMHADLNRDSLSFKVETLIPDHPWNGLTDTLFYRSDVHSDSAEKSDVLPDGVKLEQNFPNPFNPSTQITYHLSSESFVKLQVFDTTGKKIAILVDRHMSAGKHTVTFNPSGISSGVYLCRLEAGGRIVTKRMTLMK